MSDVPYMHHFGDPEIMWENGDKNEENAEKDDSGRSDDNTTTIEFTNPTVQFSQSVVQNTMWIPVAFPNTMWMLLPRQREHCVYA